MLDWGIPSDRLEQEAQTFGTREGASPFSAIGSPQYIQRRRCILFIQFLLLPLELRLRRGLGFGLWGVHPIAASLKMWKPCHLVVTNQPPDYHAAAEQHIINQQKALRNENT